MSEQLSAFRIRRGRKVFDLFSALNSFSFALVTGNTITLFALAMGASRTVIGLLGAFLYLSFFAIPLGKIGMRYTSLIGVFSRNWLIRTLSLVPLLTIPALVHGGHRLLPTLILLGSMFAFNFFRGIGLIANNPVISSLAPGKDRGEYIVRLSLINNGTGLLATVLLAFLLWHDAGLGTYALVILAGILVGLAASLLLRRLPEPDLRSAVQGGPVIGFMSRFRTALREPNFRFFVVSYLVIGLGIGMVRPFIIVYCKDVYGQTDSVLTLFTVCASLGALGMGTIMRLVIDRLGAKPMYVIFGSISLLSLVPAVLAPGVGTVLFPIVFLCLVSAFANMGFTGQENAAQTYFFTMVSKEDLMDLSMLYYFILGGTGAIGSILGGALLDGMAAASMHRIDSFRLFFGISILIIGVGIYLQRKLLELGSYPVKETLAILFSPRDMRALTLLRKLDAADDPDEETGILAELGEVASAVSAEGLVAHLSSPRFAIRYEALKSVASLRRLNARTRDALFYELEHGVFLTAAIAARLLGQFTVSQALPQLRTSLSSPDYRLSGESMLALARLGDQRSQFLIGDILLATDNPFVQVRGVQAMEEYGTASSIPLLIDLLRNPNLSDHVVKETLLALASLMGIQKRFHYAFDSWVRSAQQSPSILLDLIDERSILPGSPDAALSAILLDFNRAPEADEPFVRWILDFGKGRTGVYSALLIGGALDADLNRLESFRFFLCFWAASVFVNPALIEK